MKETKFTPDLVTTILGVIIIVWALSIYTGSLMIE